MLCAGVRPTQAATAQQWFRRNTQYRHLEIDPPLARRSRSRAARAYQRIVRVLSELDGQQSDEHGGWSTGIAHPSKRSTVAVNVDLYGLDVVNGQALGVVQVRRWEQRASWAYNAVRKSYFLVGRNEVSKTAFAHPIPSRVVRAAIRRDPSASSPVTAARAWVLQVDRNKLASIVRHGDVALVPVRRLPAGEQAVLESPVAVVDSHVLAAGSIVRISDKLYARDPRLTHSKGQHADVSAAGWHRVQVGMRAAYWTFATPTSD